MNKRPRKTEKYLKQSLIEKTKREIKEDLDKNSDSENPRTRLTYAIKKLNSLNDSLGAIDNLRRYILIVSILIHHQRFGGLNGESQINALKRLAYSVLAMAKKNLNSLHLTSFHSDLHMALSQIYRKYSSPFLSAWEHQLAIRLGAVNGADDGYEALGTALRALRLGQTDYALQNYELAETMLDKRTDFMQARLGRIKALRMSYKLDEAEELVVDTKKLGSLEDDERRELIWSGFCIRAQRNLDIESMIEATRRSGKSHYHGVYVAESLLWARSVSNFKYLKLLSKFMTVKRNKKLSLFQLNHLYKFICALENCYDYEYPFEERMDQLGTALAYSQKIVSIDHELLIWAAASRFLARCHARRLAKITLNHYRGLCLRLSDGLTGDVLGVMGDLFDKQWYKTLCREEPIVRDQKTA
jgi:hypothetical protein